MNKNGSSIVFIMTITAVITLILLHALNAALCSSSIVLKRQQYEQRFRAVQGLLFIICNTCKEHWDALAKHAPYEWVTEFPVWPCSDSQSGYSGKAFVVIENESRMQITGSLVNEKKESAISMHCILERINKTITIHSWGYG